MRGNHRAAEKTAAVNRSNERLPAISDAGGHWPAFMTNQSPFSDSRSRLLVLFASARSDVERKLCNRTVRVL